MGHNPEMIAAYEPGRICTCNGCFEKSVDAAPACVEGMALAVGAAVGVGDGMNGGVETCDAGCGARRLPSTVASAARMASKISATENPPAKKACCATWVRSSFG